SYKLSISYPYPPYSLFLPKSLLTIFRISPIYFESLNPSPFANLTACAARTSFSHFLIFSFSHFLVLLAFLVLKNYFLSLHCIYIYI
ncbi:hypothetical protein HMPREF9072_02420, partial [Capnocytophaga sp. oral taxon 324 str. F0483]